MNQIRKNFIYNIFYQALLIILPFITAPFLARKLGAESLGTYSYILSIASYFVLFGVFGSTLYGQREVAYVQKDKTKRSQVFFELLIFRIITISLSSFLFYLFYAHEGYYKILLLDMLSNMLDISWLFQGLEEFKKLVLRNAIIKLTGVACIFLLIKKPEDLWIYFLIYTLSNVLGNLSLWLDLPKYITRVKKIEIKKHIKPVFVLFIPQIAIQIYTVLDRTMLGTILKDMAEVGYYEEAQKIVKLLTIIVASFGNVMIPRIANAYEQKEEKQMGYYLQKSFESVWFLGIPIMFGIIGIAKNFVPWFLGEEYNKVISLLIYFSPLVMAIGLNNIVGMQYLIPTKKEHYFTISVVSGALINFILNFILIPTIGSIGAIIASVTAEFSVLFIECFFSKKIISIKLLFSNSLKRIISGMIMCIVVLIVGDFFEAKFIYIVIQIIVGVFIYFILLWILRDSYIKEIKNILNSIIGKFK